MDIEFEPELFPAIVLTWDGENEVIVLRNQGYDIMESTNSIALSIDDDGVMYGLRKNKDGKLEWDLIVDVDSGVPTLGVVK